VELQLTADGVLVKPRRRKRHSLSELVKGITNSNRHEEVAFGKPEGREVW
jgi:antitoxin MazE